MSHGPTIGRSYVYYHGNRTDWMGKTFLCVGTNAYVAALKDSRGSIVSVSIRGLIFSWAERFKEVSVLPDLPD